MVHDWICEVSDKVIHVPTILVTEIQKFPDCIEWIRQETAEGRMLPEIHGLEHKDYASLNSSEIVLELDECRDWIFRQFGHTATKFYSPWGAGADERGAHIRGAAKSIGIELVTCEGMLELKGGTGVINQLKNGRDIRWYDDKEIIIHWWEGVGRLRRFIEVVKHGSWEAAKVANREIFRENT
jgi:peptidoglycan/xylan/chitin deacetylase (PgdA/CDA1 family)